MNGLRVFGCIALTMVLASWASAGSAFTYQGSLKVSGIAANGAYDFQFRLFSASTLGTQFGPTVAINDLPVERGLFNASLDFGQGPFNGGARWLEIGVRPGTSTGAYTILQPRQEIRPTPYAIHARKAMALGENLAVADNSTRQITLNDTILAALDSLGRLRAALGIFGGGESGLAAWGPNGNLNVDASSSPDNADLGYIGAADAQGSVQSALSVFDSGAGGVLTWGSNGTINTSLGALGGDADKGFIAAADERGEMQSTLFVAQGGEGAVNLWGANDSLNVDIGATLSSADHGYVGVADAEGFQQAAMSVNDTGEGAFASWGPNGNINVDISSMTDLPNHGFVGVADEDGALQAGMYVDADGDGIVFADFKSFVVDHPKKPGEKIVYVSLEGPEAGIYERGVARLENGSAMISLPEHFVALADPKTISVQLTPGSFESAGVGYRVINGSQVEVRELNGGTGSYEVSYFVQAQRAGSKNLPVVMTKAEFEKRFKPAQASMRRAGLSRAASRPTTEDASRLRK